MSNPVLKIMLNVISEFDVIFVFLHGIKHCSLSISPAAPLEMYHFRVDTIRKQNTVYLIYNATCNQVSQMTFSTNATPFSERRPPKHPTCIKEQLRNFKLPVASQLIY